MEFLETIVARLRNVWNSMSLNQRVISGGVLVAAFIAIAYISSLRGSMQEYTVLFTELDSKSASEITTRLDKQKIAYRLSSDGATIEVPKEKATQLKIDFTAEGLPGSGIVGFEILDTTNFGMAERIQEVQIQRAFQGELSKTLMSLDAVEWANVSLSIPEPTLFTDKEKPTTAAVILKFRRSKSLSQKQIEGLTNLIASAVPGLDPKNVAIVDTQGNSLTKSYQDETAMMSSTQWEYKTQVDKYFATEAKRLLDGAYGVGKSLVTVNSELNWDKVERKSTSYDQTKSAIVSEERSTTSTPTPDGVGEEEYSTLNYDTGQIIENFVKNTGDISRLTVSVFVDMKDSSYVDANGAEQVRKIPWDDAHLASIRAMTENAVGFNVDRGDKIEVVQAQFGGEVMPVKQSGFSLGGSIADIMRTIIMGAAILAAIGVFFFIVKSISKSLDPSKITVQVEAEFEKHKAELAQEEEAPTSDKDILIRKIIKTSMDNPEMAAKTLKTFFRDEN
jgi:flagellar M-ring protein FliF